MAAWGVSAKLASDERTHTAKASHLASLFALLQELQGRLAESQASLQRLGEEQRAWEAERGALQSQLAAAKKAQALAQSKLVLARQREAQLKVGKSTCCQHSCDPGSWGLRAHGVEGLLLTVLCLICPSPGRPC